MRSLLLRRERRQCPLTLAQAKYLEQRFYQLSQSLNLTLARQRKLELTRKTTLGGSSGDPGGAFRPHPGQISTSHRPDLSAVIGANGTGRHRGPGHSIIRWVFITLYGHYPACRDPRQCAFDHSTIMLISLIFHRVCPCFLSV